MILRKSVTTALLISSALMAGTETDSLFDVCIGKLHYGQTNAELTSEAISLIDEDADVNAKGKYSDFHFLKAISYGHYNIALAMAENGANAKMVGEYGNTPIYNLLSSISKNDFSLAMNSFSVGSGIPRSSR